MAWVIEARNAAADALRARVTEVRIHSGDPGAAGANNRIGNSLAITYGAAANGTASATNLPLDFAVGAGVTVTHVTYYDGTAVMQRSRAVTPETFAAAGTYRITSADITAADEV
jgi:hypothetical protein